MNVFCLGSFSERFRSLGYVSERSLDMIFSFFFLVFGQGAIHDEFSYRLVPLLQTITTFYKSNETNAHVFVMISSIQ